MTAYTTPKRAPSYRTKVKHLAKQHQSKPSEARPYLRAASKEPWRIPNADLAEARLLQRKGLLLSEIAEHLELPRAAVVRSLYWDLPQ